MNAVCMMVFNRNIHVQVFTECLCACLRACVRACVCACQQKAYCGWQTQLQWEMINTTGFGRKLFRERPMVCELISENTTPREMPPTHKYVHTLRHVLYTVQHWVLGSLFPPASTVQICISVCVLITSH